jgi:formylmethanofuran dehydrogenase subunit D
MSSPAAETFILIPGRTSRQGTSLNEGKLLTEYREETQTVLANPADLARLGLAAGDRVRLRSAFGESEAVVQPAKPNELPPGLLFMAYGDRSSRLMGADTHGTGMPTSKGIDVTVEKVA